MSDPNLWLKPGRDRSLRLRHPWVFSGSIDRVDGSIPPGGTVNILSSSGEWLARAAFNPVSNIRARVWTWLENQQVDEEIFSKKIQNALNLRTRLNFYKPGGACRLVYSEGDGLPGLIVDRYDDWLVVQFLTAGAEYWRGAILSALEYVTKLDRIYERSDSDVRQLEGLQDRSGLIRGQELPGRTLIEEKGHKYYVDIVNGQKTGFYIDQRLSRRWVRQWSGKGRVLNAFCYTGAFTVCALAGGASEVVSLDSSASAIAMAKENVLLNKLQLERCQWLNGDVFTILRDFRDRGETYDTIILDPPKFAPTVAQASKAARGYKDINLLAMKLLNPGGLLFTFSCSGGVSADLFQKIVHGAVLDAGMGAQIIERMTQSPDHPVSINFPEGEYLKGLVLRKE